MIGMIVIAVLALLAVICGLTIGLSQTSKLFSVIFYILVSGTAVNFLFLPPVSHRKKKGHQNKPDIQQEPVAGEVTPPAAQAEKKEIPDDTTQIINKLDNLLRDSPAEPASLNTADQEPNSRIPEHAQLRDLGNYEMIAVGLARNRGHELTLQSKKDGVFLAQEYGGTVFVSLPDSYEEAGSNLSSLGIQHIFTLLDDQKQELKSFPQGRLQLTVAQDARCRFYDDGAHLALTKKGTIYVTPGK